MQNHGSGTPDLARSLGRLRVALDAAYVDSARQVGLTAQQAELLCAAMDAAAVGNLARALRCDRSNVSRLVDRTAARGLLHRRGDEADGRVSMVELTPHGRALAERFIESLESRTAALVAAWPPERRANADAILNEIADTVEMEPSAVERSRP